MSNVVVKGNVYDIVTSGFSEKILACCFLQRYMLNPGLGLSTSDTHYSTLCRVLVAFVAQFAAQNVAPHSTNRSIV